MPFPIARSSARTRTSAFYWKVHLSLTKVMQNHTEYTRYIDEEKGNIKVKTALSPMQSHDNLLAITIVSSAWQYIPADVIYLIARHLDGRSLARFGSCDRVSRSVVQRVDLWRNLTNKQWQARWMDHTIEMRIYDVLEGVGLQRHKPEFDARRYYAARYTATRKERRLAKMRHLSKASRSARIFGLRWIEEVAMPTLIVALFILFIGILIGELHSSSGEVTYRSLWPLLAITSIIFLSLTNLFYIRWRNSILCCCSSDSIVHPVRSALYIDTSRRLIADSYWQKSNSRVIQLIRLIEGAEMLRAEDSTDQVGLLLAHLSTFAVFFGIAVWITLITLKVTNATIISWSLVWLPLYFSFGLFTLGVLFLGWFPDDAIYQRAEFRSSIPRVLCMIPVLLMMILIHLYLIDSISRLQYALMPLTIVHGILFLMAFGSICLGGGTDYSIPIWIIAIPGWILLPAPLLLFQLFLMLKVDGDWVSISWVGVFAPLFFPLALLFIGVLGQSRVCHLILRSDAMEARRSFPTSRVHMIFDMPEV